MTGARRLALRECGRSGSRRCGRQAPRAPRSEGRQTPGQVSASCRGRETDLLEVGHVPEGVQLHGRLVLPQLAAPGLVELPQDHLRAERRGGQMAAWLPGKPALRPGPRGQRAGAPGAAAPWLAFPPHPALAWA